MRTNGQNNSSLLAIHGGALGDVVIFGHLLAALGGASTLVTGAAKGKLLAGVGLARRALDIDALPMHEAFHYVTAGDAAGASQKLAEFIDPHGRLISCFAAGDTAAELRLAAIFGCDSASFLPVRPEADFAGHLLELWCDMLGLEANAARPPAPWMLPQQWRRWATQELGKFGIRIDRPFAVMHVGSGSVGKCWPPERFVALARSLDLPTVMVLGEAELERWPRQVQQLLRGFPTLRHPQLDMLAAVLEACRFYVGNDSGVSHLAAAVGANTIAMFGPSNPRHFAPLGRSVRIVQGQSMQDISVAQVRDATAEWVK